MPRGLTPHLYVLLALSLAATPVAGAIVTWPSASAPCDDINNLEACINGVAEGDIIEIAADAIPGQSVTVSPGKSFTLRPADGFTPTFGDFTSIFAGGSDEDITVVIEGLTIARGSITTRQGGSGTFDVTLRNNSIQQVSTFGTALRVSSGNTQPPYGPTKFLIENNLIDINVGATDRVSAIAVNGFQGDGNTGSILGNVIHQVGGDQNGAIDIGNGNVTLDVDVIGNQISGTSFNAGVGIFQFADEGQVTARVINNVISGQVDAAGAPAAISLSVSGGHADFTVINNSVAFNDRGLLLTGRPDLGATASTLIANNIIAFNTQGMSIGDFETTTTNEFNLVFGNAFDSFTPGPGFLNVNPQFLSSDDLRLESGSPALDSGANDRIAGDITQDVAGNPRILGTVDRGAFEIGGGTAARTAIVSAVLPSSRSVEVSDAATAFAAITNAGGETATGCSIAPETTVPADFLYRTTDPATNEPTGQPNTRVDILSGEFQTFLFALTPTASFDPTDIELRFVCTNTDPAPVTIGLNTLLLSASNAPIPDIVALAATLDGDGIVKLASTGIFAVATVYVGIAGTITVSADTGSATLPVSIALCETDPATGVCINPTEPTSVPVTTSIGANATPTFAFFVTGTAPVPFDPANNRIFVRFEDIGGVTRGATSVAVVTTEP
jgi:hypothetical protein